MRNPVMIGQRVYLRALEVSDSEILAGYTAIETDTFMYRASRVPVSPLEYEAWIKEAYKKTPPSFAVFAVCLRKNDQIIGHMDIGSIDWVNRTGETASYLAPESRNSGLGTEAKHLLIEYGFDRLQLHTIISTVFENNTRSAAALAKQGYRPAGRLRWHDVKDGVYRDMLVFDLLRDEWLAAREQWQATQAQRTNKNPTE